MQSVSPLSPIVLYVDWGKIAQRNHVILSLHNCLNFRSDVKLCMKSGYSLIDISLTVTVLYSAWAIGRQSVKVSHLCRIIMFDLEKEYSISFSGCGFMGIYYVGATTCILERFPMLIEKASKIYGVSAGALLAAALTVGIPMDEICADLMLLSKRSREHKLGPLHPAFNLLETVKESMLRILPEDAYVRASGKLGISVSRVLTGKNSILSEFDNNEELIQALLCSCFIPVYCGVVPPSYRGVRYMDGAISNNQPICQLRHTLTFSAYAGKSDICPRDGTRYFHAFKFNNVSIQINSENVYRVASTFFPPEPQITSGVCNTGYMDALRWLQENGLIHVESPLEPTPPCCELVAEQTKEEPPKNAHRWLDHTTIHNLPVSIKKVLCEACREDHEGCSQLTKASTVQVASSPPVGSMWSMGRRLVDRMPGLSPTWLYHKAGELYKQAWMDAPLEHEGSLLHYTPLRRCASLPSHLDVFSVREETEQVQIQALTLTPPPTPSDHFYFANNTKHDFLPLTPPPTPPIQLDTTNPEVGCVEDVKCQTRLSFGP